MKQSNQRPARPIVALLAQLAFSCAGDDANPQGKNERPDGGFVECGGHGQPQKEQCVCDDGYVQDPEDPRTCEPAAAQTGERLVVADGAAKRLYVFDVDSWELIAQFDDVEVNDHVGFLPLEDGRLLFVDMRAQALRIAAVAGVEEPELGPSVPLAGAPAHLAIDPDQQYAAVSASAGADTGDEGAFTLVDLESATATEVRLPTGEPGIALGGDPLMLFHRNDTPAQFEMYSVADLLAGEIELVDNAAIGEGPHGEVIAHSRELVVSAAGDGINIVPFADGAFGSVSKVPYDVDGKSGGRAFYARLSGDGRYLYSYLRDAGPEGTTWKDWKNDVYIVDLEEQAARRITVGNGLVYRLGTCPTMAAFTQYAPEGDFLHLMQADPEAEDFQDLIASIPLDSMSQTPGPEGDVWASPAFRVTTLSTDCKWAFVTQGGDGKVVVVDTLKQEVARTLTLPSKLDFGGYLVSMRAGVRTPDTIAR